MPDLLQDIGFGYSLARLIAVSMGVLVVGVFGLVLTLFLIWAERKIAGRFQDRPGPNRVGPYGIIQSFADLVKIVIKEDIMPVGVDRWVFNLAPILTVTSVILVWAVIPFTPDWIGTDLSVAVVYIIAVGSIGTVAVVMAGWGSNNKYSLLAAYRAVAQLISYEIPMVLALMVPVLLAGTLSTQGIIQAQHIWYVFALPVTWLIFMISAQAENGRGPFDLLEAESELVSGFHIEYSGMKFGMFYVGEFLHAFTMGVLFAIFYLGGWRGPFVYDAPILGFFYLMIKSALVYFVLIWVRMTLPRLRIDQLLDFNWKFMVPLSLLNLLVVAFVWKIVPGTDSINGFGEAFGPMLALLVANLAMLGGIAAVLRSWGRRDRARIAARMNARMAPVPPVEEAAPAGAGAPAHAGD